MDQNETIEKNTLVLLKPNFLPCTFKKITSNDTCKVSFMDKAILVKTKYIVKV